MELHTIGIDLGKTVFHLVGLNQRGEVVVRKKFSRKQLLHFTANLQVKLIGMEACGGSHFLGRALREQGHEVRLMPAQYVKPYLKTNKSDYIDAEAIAEAVERPKMRFVPIKSDDQLDMQSLHRVRERWVMRRTAVINQIRGLLLERGITLRQGRCHVDAALPGILEDACRQALRRSARASDATEAGARSLANTNRRSRCHDQQGCCRERRLPTAGSDPWHRTCYGYRNHRRDRQRSSFQKGARFSAWLGIVPGEYTTGGKQKLLGISKRGNSYLRRLFVQGARAVLQQSAKQSSGLSAWLAQLTTRTHSNVAAVALANKLARMAWAVLAKNETYRPPMLVGAATA